jgi:uncharacterized protein YaiI (UPF0178 family)
MKILADGDSLESELRNLLCRRSLGEAARAADSGLAPRFCLIVVAAKKLRLPGAEFVLVAAGPDAADDKIVELAESGDLAVTRDIPLAERLVEKGVSVLNDRGEVYSRENVHERRSIRDRAAELRALGLAPQSPRTKSWGDRELKLFADAFDRELTRLLLSTVGGGGGPGGRRK